MIEGRKPGNNLDYQKCLQLIDRLNFKAKLGGGDCEWEEGIPLSLVKFGPLSLNNCVVQK